MPPSPSDSFHAVELMVSLTRRIRCGPRRAGRGRLPPGSGAVSDDDSAAALGAVVWASVAGELVGGAAALATTAVPPRASTAGTAAIASLFLQFYIDA